MPSTASQEETRRERKKSPSRLKSRIRSLGALLAYPRNRAIYWAARRRGDRLQCAPDPLLQRNRRLFAYDHALLPNKFVAAVEAASDGIEGALERSGQSVGYPAWNLLYYTLLCSLPVEEREVVVVETGTNVGFSTIILAQVLKDRSCRGRVRTVDIDPGAVEKARANVEKAGLGDYVAFHTGDSLEFLERLAAEVDYIDFAFLDGSHKYRHVRREFALVYPRVVACRGKVYFDNTSGKGLSRALDYVRRAYGGNLIQFTNCSWSRPGNALWQAD